MESGCRKREEGRGLGKQIEQPQEPRSPSALSELRPDLLTWELMQLAGGREQGGTRGGVRRRCCRGLWWGQCGKQFVFGYFVFACNMHTPGRQTRCLADWVVAPGTSHPLPSPSLPSWRCNVVLSPLWRQCTHALPTVRTMRQQDSTDRQRSAMSNNDKWFKTKGTINCEH